MERAQVSISAVTTYTATAETDIASFRAAGADGIGLWEYKLANEHDEEVLHILRDSGLRATLCCGRVPSVFPDSYFSEPSEPVERVKAMCASIERLAKFEPVAVLCVTGDPRGRDVEDMRDMTVKGLRTVARFAAGLGVTLGVEPYRADAGSLVSTLPDTVRLIDEIDEPNVAVIADTWHFWDLPGIEDDLRRYVERLIGIQVNDYREPNRGWCDRRLPGEGIIEYPSILGALDAAGYSGWYDIEVFSDNGLFGNRFSDSIWDEDPYEVARRSVVGFRHLWDERRLVT